MTHKDLYAHGRVAAQYAIWRALSKYIESTISHPVRGGEIAADDCTTCGEHDCDSWRYVQEVEASLPDTLLPTTSQDEVIALLDEPGTSRWAARWIRRGARDYLREADEATGHRHGLQYLAERSLFFRGTGPWPYCERRYVARA